MDEFLPWIRLANLQISPRMAGALLDAFGSPEAVFNASPAELEQAAGSRDRIAGRVLDATCLPTSAQLRAIERLDVRIITRDSADFPARLKEIPDPPPTLFVRGELDERDRFAVAIVGSRSASPYGRSVTARLARDLAAAGLTVVSGGAIGIDTAAHRAVVESSGRTIAVLGCGLDVEYPRENQPLFSEIACGRGAALTEFPPGAQPEPWRFPMRNRVISGLAMGVVVVEAGKQSGALLTATMATEQGRDVMAVPGNVDRPGSRGTNALIRDGAILVEEAADVLSALGILALESPPAELRPPARDLPEPQRRLLGALSLSPRHIDSIAADLQMPGVEVSVQLTMMELSGQVRRLPGNCYIRAL